jgi:hypothetical protein
MNQLVTTENSNNAIATTGANAFEAFANAVAPKYILGKLLRFSKGDFLAGERQEMIPLGTKFVAGMDLQLVGWVRWDGGKPAEHQMVRVIDGRSPPRRSELGDHDPSKWEADFNGKQRDPWSLTHYLPLIDETGEVFTFSTTSRGGTGALADLARYYGSNLNTHPNDFPVIELQVGTYQHQNAQFGRIKFPTFKRCGWESKITFFKAVGAGDPVVEPEHLDSSDVRVPSDDSSDEIAF